MKLTSVALTLFLLSMTQSALAAIDLIHISNSCPPTARDDEPRPMPDCGGENACRSAGQMVRWEVDGSNEQFSVNFSDTSLFENYGQGLCRADSGSAGKIQCRIAANLPIGSEYTYSISLGSCVGDPKIIIH